MDGLDTDRGDMAPVPAAAGREVEAAAAGEAHK